MVAQRVSPGNAKTKELETPPFQIRFLAELLRYLELWLTVLIID